MSQQIKVGIAGLGRSGWNMHANALSKLPEHFQVAAVMDPREERRAEANSKFGCETFTSFEELTQADIELLVIATPSQFHKEHTISALNAGKNVIVEKPLASNVSEVDEMITAAKNANKILTVNQNYRYHSYSKTMSDVMASGKLGEIVQIRVAIHQFSRRWDWQTLRKNNGGILTNHGAHYLDWALLHFEDNDPEVFCHLVDTPLYAGDADSHAKVIVRPKDGPLIDIELTHCSAYPQDTFLIMGTQGSLRGTREKLEWKYFIPENEVKLELDHEPTHDRSYNRESLTFIEESKDLNTSFGDDMILLYQDLFASIRESAPLQITVDSVRRQIDIFDKCRLSSGWF